jgi:hypothetical protein
VGHFGVFGESDDACFGETFGYSKGGGGGVN